MSPRIGASRLSERSAMQRKSRRPLPAPCLPPGRDAGAAARLSGSSGSADAVAVVATAAGVVCSDADKSRADDYSDNGIT